MEQEVLALNGWERDRLKVLHEAEKQHIRQREAAEQLRLSERQVRRLLARLREEGDRGLVHKLRGQKSKRRIGEEVERQAMGIVAREYAGFGPTLAAEYMASDHGLPVSRETLRKWMLQAGLWKRRKQRVLEVHVWRPRRSCVGELVQWDTSEHDWLEGRTPRLALVAMLDDASSRALARFVERDTTEENLRLLGTYLERWGRPEAFYTDKDSMFAINRPGKETPGEDEVGEEAWTQIGRALKELGIAWIAAHSPQAKGRVERFFGTAQDRLVKGLRKAGAGTIAEANRYLERVYLPLWNGRFTVKPAKGTDAHRPLRGEHDLAAILSHVEERVVAADYPLSGAAWLHGHISWLLVVVHTGHFPRYRTALFFQHDLALAKRLKAGKDLVNLAAT
jgi:transposase